MKELKGHSQAQDTNRCNCPVLSLTSCAGTLKPDQYCVGLYKDQAEL